MGLSCKSGLRARRAAQLRGIGAAVSQLDAWRIVTHPAPGSVRRQRQLVNDAVVRHEELVRRRIEQGCRAAPIAGELLGTASAANVSADLLALDEGMAGQKVSSKPSAITICTHKIAIR